MTIRHTRILLALLTCSLCLVDCSSDPGGPDPEPERTATAVRLDVRTVVLQSLGESAPVHAFVVDAQGSPITGLRVTWSTSNAAVATVSDEGRITAVGDGVATVVAVHGSLRDSVEVRVARVAAGLELSRESVLLVGVNDTATVEARVTDARGNALAGATPQWTSTAGHVAVVNSSGVITAVGSGQARARASVGTHIREVTVRVYGVTGEGVTSLDRVVAEHLARLNVPGAALAVTHQGRLVHARGYGLADTIARTPYLVTTRSRIASVSKSITAAGIMSLAESGTLSLDDRVFVRWVGDLLPAPGPADARLLDITIRQLLQHSGGWNQPPNDPMFQPNVIAAWAGVSSPPDARTIIRYVATQPLQFAPGTQRYYSNVGYAILGKVIERATGKSYASWVRDNLFAGSAPGVEPGRSLLAQRAADETAYYAGGAELGLYPSVFANQPGLVPYPYGAFAVEPLGAAGGLIASARDLVHFLTAVDGKSTRPDVIGGPTRIAMGVDAGLPGNLAAYGSGWFRTGSTWYHIGRIPGMISAVVMDDARDLTFAVLYNYSEPTAAYQSDFANSMLAAVTGVTAWPVTDLFLR